MLATLPVTMKSTQYLNSMKIKWLRKALNNVQEIHSYIGMENPKAAKIELQKIENTVDLLSKNPAIGKPGRVPNTREIITGNYIIPYRIEKNQIQIIRVFDS